MYVYKICMYIYTYIYAYKFTYILTCRYIHRDTLHVNDSKHKDIYT